MPTVAQVSSPSARTSSTMRLICSSCFGLGLRYAAPMQKRVAPLAFAACAASTTADSSSSSSRSSPVS